MVETTGGYRAAVGQVLAELPAPADVIAHRVVHGGGRLPDLVGIDGRVLGILRELTPLAPLHNGPALEGIEATLGAGVPLIAALDSAFHGTLPPRAWRYAIPEFAGVRRYGFHGWSHVTERYAALTGSSEPTSDAAPRGRLLRRRYQSRALSGHLDGLFAARGPGDGHPRG